MVRPNILNPFKQQSNYDSTVCTLEELFIHACELYKYSVDKNHDYFIVVQWIETPVSSLFKNEMELENIEGDLLGFP